MVPEICCSWCGAPSLDLFGSEFCDSCLHTKTSPCECCNEETFLAELEEFSGLCDECCALDDKQW